jgi:hypothetical protein
MTTAVTLTADALLVEPIGLDKLWSFTRRLTIPLAHVRGATFDPDVAAEPKGLRHPGLAVPGKWAGTFTKDGDTCFWNVSARRSGHRHTIVIQLDREKYQRLYLTVADPRATVDAINAALSRLSSSTARERGFDRP